MTTVCTGANVSHQTPADLAQSRIEVDFSCGTQASNAGALRIGLSVHNCRNMTGERIPGSLLGDKEVNKRDRLRSDPVLGTVLGCLGPGKGSCGSMDGKIALNSVDSSGRGIKCPQEPADHCGSRDDGPVYDLYSVCGTSGTSGGRSS